MDTKALHAHRVPSVSVSGSLGLKTRLFMVSALIASIASSSIISSQAMAASTCFTASAAKAAQLRVLKEAFDVAGMVCPNNGAVVIRDRYNVFVTNFQGTFVSNARVLRSHFGSEKRLDSWMTNISNVVSNRAAIDTPTYCGRTTDNLEKAILVSPKELEASPTAFDSEDGDLVPVCGTGKHSVKKAVLTKHVHKSPAKTKKESASATP